MLPIAASLEYGIRFPHRESESVDATSDVNELRRDSGPIPGQFATRISAAK